MDLIIPIKPLTDFEKAFIYCLQHSELSFKEQVIRLVGVRKWKVE